MEHTGTNFTECAKSTQFFLQSTGISVCFQQQNATASFSMGQCISSTSSLDQLNPHNLTLKNYTTFTILSPNASFSRSSKENQS